MTGDEWAHAAASQPASPLGADGLQLHASPFECMGSRKASAGLPPWLQLRFPGYNCPFRAATAASFCDTCRPLPFHTDLGKGLPWLFVSRWSCRGVPALECVTVEGVGWPVTVTASAQGPHRLRHVNVSVLKAEDEGCRV